MKININKHPFLSMYDLLISPIIFILIVVILIFVSSGCKTTNTSSVQDTEQLMPNLLRPEKAEVPQKAIMAMPGK